MSNINQISNLLSEDVKKHYAKREQAQIVNIKDISNFKDKDEKDNIENKKNSYLEKYKNNLMIRLGVLLIIFALILFYPQFPEKIKENKYINWIKSEYSKNYSKEYVVENFEVISRKAYNKIKKFVPEKVYELVVSKYINNIKPIILGDYKNNNENLKINNTVSAFNDESINSENNGNDNLILAQTVATSSEISQMDIDVQEILSKNINISCPVKGTVTSIYGAREEIFKNVAYHTGVDIANSLNTPVSSATDGVVVLTQNMDKYYGNNIEIENNGVIFKYAHLNRIDVKEGDEIFSGQIIGLMGSTGASTGSHLHFEIKINNRTVDPELLVNVR